MKVMIYDWEEDASQRNAISAIRIATALNVAGARRAVEKCIEGHWAVVECIDNQSALDMIDQLDEAGFMAKRIPEGD